MLWRSVQVGKDFRIGLIAGLVFVVAAMIWVATRPSLSPEARLLGPAATSSPQRTTSDRTAAPRPDDGQRPSETTPPGLVPADPEEQPLVSNRSAPDSIRPEEPTISGPNFPDLRAYEQPEKIQTTRFHIVLKNENLSSISKQHYGTPNNWQKILRANRDVIEDANKITPGTKLIIPD
jgi:nucleoid-associated protein YgaU